MSLVFKRTIEDFTCGQCGEKIKGTGYTNHCPACLWSKHADINPGDRKEKCGGMMRPIRMEIHKGDFYVVHKCEKCGIERRTRMSRDDNRGAVLG